MPMTAPSRPPVLASRRRSVVSMATVVSIEVVLRRDDPASLASVDAAIGRAFAWLDQIEMTCSRFLAHSELSRLSSRAGEPVAVSPLLFEALQFSLAVAEASGGAFDPTVGARMARRGFDREHRSGQAADAVGSSEASFRDVELDARQRTILLRRPLTLDLGAVAKGLAVDMAARELAEFADFVIDAGGDIYAAGRSTRDEPWVVGIRHPREVDAVAETVALTDRALCTSGDYERRSPTDGGHHIIDPTTGEASGGLSSVSVIASTAMVADALATAAFVLGPDAGLAFLEAQGVAAVLYTSGLDRLETRGVA